MKFLRTTKGIASLFVTLVTLSSAIWGLVHEGRIEITYQSPTIVQNCPSEPIPTPEQKESKAENRLLGVKSSEPENRKKPRNHQRAKDPNSSRYIDVQRSDQATWFSRLAPKTIAQQIQPEFRTITVPVRPPAVPYQRQQQTIIYQQAPVRYIVVQPPTQTVFAGMPYRRYRPRR